MLASCRWSISGRVKKFTDRHTAVNRIWQALRHLAPVAATVAAAGGR